MAQHAGRCGGAHHPIITGVIVVIAFAGAQLHRLDPQGVPYLVANAGSTCVLAAVALIEAQYGFVLTNGFWAAISTLGLARHGWPAEVLSAPVA